jgi:DNA primase small subunit
MVYAPPNVENREFGFVEFDEQGMMRHIGFKSESELKAFLKRMAPSNAYYSCAYYQYPDAAMDAKGWMGADLIFDIDADHIPTPCGKVHDEWTCANCGFIGKGLTPEKCPVCGGEKFDVKTWPCEECLNSAKTEAVKLLDILQHDFGFSENEIHIFFSGHRGYHIHIENETVKTLDAVARKEIVDYVCGLGLDTGFQGSAGKKPGKTRLPSSPRLDDLGWRGRLAKKMYGFVLNAKQEDYVRLGLKKNVIEVILLNANAILKSWDGVGPYSAVKGVGVETWRRIVEFCVESLSAKVDTVVTTDIHRLIRLTGALHGKTGLKKVEFPISDIETFDPFLSAVAFKKGTVSVFVSDAPKFRLGDEVFGPFKNQRVELPTATAVLLICKNRAEAVE